MTDKKERNRLLLYYTLGFILIFGFIVFEFYYHGYSLLNNNDGFRQDYRNILYFYNYIKDFFYNLFVNHKLVFNEWDFSIGEGSAVFQTIGITFRGPFDLLYLFFPEGKLYIAHDIVVGLRMYLCGLSFIYMCLYKKKENMVGMLVASLIYATNFCCLYKGLTSYRYIISFIMLPLMVVGIDKIFNNEKPFLFILTVGITIFYDFYQFYQVALIIFIYTMVKVFFVKDGIKNKLLLIIRIGLYALLGMAMSAVTLLPTLDTYLGNARVGATSNHGIFNYLSMLKSLLTTYVSFDFSQSEVFGGYTVVGLLCMFLFLKNRKNKQTVVLTLISLIITTSGLFYSVFNAMSYPTNRWYFGVVLLYCFFIPEAFNELLDLDKKSFIYLLIISAIYFGYCFLNDDESRTKVQLLLLLITLVSIILLYFLKNKKLKQAGVICLTVGSLLFNQFYFLSPYSWSFINRGTEIDKLADVLNNENTVVKELNDDDFYRYSLDEYDRYDTNSSINAGTCSTNFYWSETNNYVSTFRSELGLLDHNSYHYDNYNGRYALNALSGVKYLLNKNASTVISNEYDYLKDSEGYSIYETDEALPLIYGYENKMAYSEFEKLSALEKQEALTETAVSQEGDFSYRSSVTSVKYEINSLDGVEFSEDGFRVLKDNAKVELIVYLNADGELYLTASDIKTASEGNTELEIEINLPDGKQVMFNHKTADHVRYSGRDTYVVYLGNYAEAIDISVIFKSTFTCAGNIRFESLSLNEQTDNINALNNVEIKSLNINGDHIEANVNLDRDEFVCLSIPYSKGWKAYVDGKEVQVERTNVMYLGFDVARGSHEIKLVFETPYLRIGAMVSLIGIGCFVFISKKYGRKSGN